LSASLNVAPIIYGCEGLRLSQEEQDFFKQVKPAGFILFQRNCEKPDQTRELVDALSALYDEEVLILIDQEGGEVSRLHSPHWDMFPPARFYGDMYKHDCEAAKRAAYDAAQQMGSQLAHLHISVNCMPVLDVPCAGEESMLGTRAYSEEAAIVADLGKEIVAGLKSKGILPVIKHMPGHGRTSLDSHHVLPIVDASYEELVASDFIPFVALAGEAIGMTAHILYTALDAKHPATLSERIINDIVRERLGFAGLLLSDDIGMGALAGDLADRACGALAAGCDIVLHCSGDLREMKEIAARLPPLSKAAHARLVAAFRQSASLGAG